MVQDRHIRPSTFGDFRLIIDRLFGCPNSEGAGTGCGFETWRGPFRAAWSPIGTRKPFASSTNFTPYMALLCSGPHFPAGRPPRAADRHRVAVERPHQRIAARRTVRTVGAVGSVRRRERLPGGAPPPGRLPRRRRGRPLPPHVRMIDFERTRNPRRAVAATVGPMKHLKILAYFLRKSSLICPFRVKIFEELGGWQEPLTQANGVPGMGRRRQYATPGYQACTS